MRIHVAAAAGCLGSNLIHQLGCDCDRLSSGTAAERDARTPKTSTSRRMLQWVADMTVGARRFRSRWRDPPRSRALPA